jgi:AcrR family transcriptional regulator
MVINMMDRPQGVKRSRKEETQVRRQQLLDAACGLIFERGFEPVSMADIGAAAGISGPGLYRHFKSKAEVLAVLCDQTIDRLIEFAGPRRATPEAELKALVEGQVQLVVHYPQLVRVFENEERSLPDDLRRHVRRREREHAQRWTDALQRLAPRADSQHLETIVFATVGMILSAPRWPRSIRTDDRMGEILLAAAWRVLADVAPATSDQI